jgi:predicted secreted protein
LPVVGIGTTLKKGDVIIANLTSIDGIAVSADTIESTNLSTEGGYRTFVNGLKDAGEVSLSGHFGYTDHSPLFNDFEASTLDSYTIEFPDIKTTTGTQWTFTAVVTGFSTSVALEDLISFEATLKVSGRPTLVAPV